MVIECVNLVVSYEKNVAVDNISFSVEEGDYLCIVGENGAGKTTLMKSLLGLINPDSGSINYNGVKSNEIGYLPQQTQVQKDFPASVGEVILSGCQNTLDFLPFYKKNHHLRAETIMESLGIGDMKKRSYRELSGGQQQRVLLARALCATRKLLLLDEPVAGLDPVAAAGLYSLIDKLNKEQGITIIMISHDIKSAVEYANKILHIQTGKSFFGSRDEYLKSMSFAKISGKPEEGGGAGVQ